LAFANCHSADEPTSSRQVVDLSGPGWSLVLEPEAAWQDDRLHLPGLELAELPTNAPRDGWKSLRSQGISVSVPGTVEQHLWVEQGGDYQGVSWWSRSFDLPAVEDGRRAVLCFEAVRLRAEVFLDGRLVGYDAVGNTPFEVDVTQACALGGRHQLDVRVTDPGGNFDWVDHTAHRWGEQTIPASHGFGGVSGPVRLEVRDALQIGFVFVKNMPAVTEVELQIELAGPEAPAPGSIAPELRVEVVARDDPSTVLLTRTLIGERVQAGPEGPVVRCRLSLSEATPWSPEDPVLYLCRVWFPGGDAYTARFGFRWFAPDGVGDDAVLRLNGERIVLRSAISWGFWSVTGLVPSRALAEKQVRTARELGLNMLNHHRTIAAPGLLDVHDELGLLAYAEPGGYWAQGGDALCFAFAREKWLRMVRRDRNHPSLVIQNMINESTEPPDGRFERDLAEAHRIDPTRLKTYTSAWSSTDDASFGLHARPGDPMLHRSGWYDNHFAPGPGVSRDQHWKGPADYLRRTENRADVVFWGEDGAIATPPRLALMAEAVEAARPGWDGLDYLAWRDAYLEYFEAKRWQAFFPDLDELTRSLGDIAFTYQADVIRNVRLGDVADGYVVNGWEGSKWENHSGIVDCDRNPKGNPAVLAEANAPLALAVKLSQRVLKVGNLHNPKLRSPARLGADIYLLNEVGLQGQFDLKLAIRDPQGAEQRAVIQPVEVVGGDVFGQPLATSQLVFVEGGPGRYRLTAELRPFQRPAAEPLARGEAEIFLVDWRNRPVPGGGALVQEPGLVAHYLNTSRRSGVPRFDAAMPALDWVLLSDLDPEPVELVPTAAYRTADGEAGVRGEYFDGIDFDELVAVRTDPSIEFDFPAKSGPLPGLEATGYSVRWTGQLTAPEAGPYRFTVRTSGGVRLWVDGRLVLDAWSEHTPQDETSAALVLDPERPVDFRLEYFQGQDNSRVHLSWSTPGLSARGRELSDELTRRVHDDGTTLLILDHTDQWARLLSERGVLHYDGKLTMGKYWMGGNFFVREHPLFKDLPVNGAMNWEYQELVHYGVPNVGLFLRGEEAVVACVSDHRPQVATAVGVVKHGKGRIVLSTLPITQTLIGPPGPKDMVKALLANYIEYAAGDGDL
jgi:beta-galactosidase